MTIWPVAGALFGAMMGLFIAREFTEHWAVCLAAGMVGGCGGIVLSFLLRGLRPDRPA